MGWNDFASCKALFERYQIPMTQIQYGQFCEFQRLMTAESERQNVSAVNDPDEIWVRHFLDSAYLYHHVRKTQPHSFLDLGTGGGFPGIPISILFPDLSVTLLDSEERKLEYCTKVIRALGLRTQCLCGRAEELSKSPQYREQFDFAASRAVANGSMLCELALPFLKIGGTFAAFKGSGYDPKIERFFEASAALEADEPIVEDYRLEGVDKHLILISKSRSTPLQYPRRYAKMKRSPL